MSPRLFAYSVAMALILGVLYLPARFALTFEIFGQAYIHPARAGWGRRREMPVRASLMPERLTRGGAQTNPYLLNTISDVICGFASSAMLIPNNRLERSRGRVFVETGRSR